MTRWLCSPRLPCSCILLPRGPRGPWGPHGLSSWAVKRNHVPLFVILPGWPNFILYSIASRNNNAYLDGVGCQNQRVLLINPNSGKVKWKERVGVPRRSICKTGHIKLVNSSVKKWKKANLKISVWCWCYYLSQFAVRKSNKGPGPTKNLIWGIGLWKISDPKW